MSDELTTALKDRARQIGFDLVGIAPAVSPAGFSSFQDWLRNGFAGEMAYLPNREPAYEHPSSVLETVRSVIMLGMNYNTGDPASGRCEPAGSSQITIPAKVAKYARGSVDYHDVLRDKLKQLGDFLHAQQPGCRTRGVVDTAPLLERDFAKLAGLGWFGKNTMLINKRAGSWLFLAALLTDVALAPDAPHETSHCGTCTRCLDVCPTDAFPKPYVLDARKCISYLTIELRGPIPEPLREGMEDWLFGCDLCQDVCPWNNKAGITNEPSFLPTDNLAPADAMSILRMDEAEFRERFRHTPLSRPKRAGLLRNAAIVLGNSGRQEAVPALLTALSDDEPLIRGAAAWALGQLGGAAALQGLENRARIENDPDVQYELAAALRAFVSNGG